MGKETQWCFELSDKLEAMAVLTKKIFAVADRVFMEQKPGQTNPLVEVIFDYALDAVKESDSMATDYCKKLLAMK